MAYTACCVWLRLFVFLVGTKQNAALRITTRSLYRAAGFCGGLGWGLLFERFCCLCAHCAARWRQATCFYPGYMQTRYARARSFMAFGVRGGVLVVWCCFAFLVRAYLPFTPPATGAGAGFISFGFAAAAFCLVHSLLQHTLRIPFRFSTFTLRHPPSQQVTLFLCLVVRLRHGFAVTPSPPRSFPLHCCFARIWRLMVYHPTYFPFHTAEQKKNF